MILNEKLFECFNPDDEATDMLDLEADKKRDELQEDFSPSFPKWLTNAIERDNVGHYLSQQGIDLNKAEFIESDPPTSGWDPKAKDPNLIKVFYLRDDNERYPHYQLYIPGYYGDVKQFDLSGNYKGIQLKTYSMKQLANHAEVFGYIDISDSKNTNFKLRKERRDVQAGDINLKRDANKQFSRRDIISYPKDERGFTDWRNPILGDLKWITNKGYDKSGYRINKDKYKEILKKLKAENYQATIEEALNKLEGYRSRLINVLSSMNLKDSKDLSAVNLASDYLYRMIESYTEVVNALERIESKDLSEKQKKESINWEVKYFLNKFTEYEEDLKRYLVKIEPKTECLGESLSSAEDIAKYQEYVDYDMKTYGKISDVTNRKLKESGLEVVKDIYGDYVVTVKEKDGKLIDEAKLSMGDIGSKNKSDLSKLDPEIQKMKDTLADLVKSGDLPELDDWNSRFELEKLGSVAIGSSDMDPKDIDAAVKYVYNRLVRFANFCVFDYSVRNGVLTMYAALSKKIMEKARKKAEQEKAAKKAAASEKRKATLAAKKAGQQTESLTEATVADQNMYAMGFQKSVKDFDTYWEIGPDGRKYTAQVIKKTGDFDKYTAHSLTGEFEDKVFTTPEEAGRYIVKIVRPDQREIKESLDHLTIDMVPGMEDLQEDLNSTEDKEYFTDEFLEIAQEIGLTTKRAYETFKKEELAGQPINKDTLLRAIKAYRQDLVDAGIDLSRLR